MWSLKLFYVIFIQTVMSRSICCITILLCECILAKWVVATLHKFFSLYRWFWAWNTWFYSWSFGNRFCLRVRWIWISLHHLFKLIIRTYWTLLFVKWLIKTASWHNVLPMAKIHFRFQHPDWWIIVGFIPSWHFIWLLFLIIKFQIQIIIRTNTLRIVHGLLVIISISLVFSF